MHLYLNGIYVGKTTIRENENPNDNIYIVHFWFKKQIFKSNHVKSAIHPTTILKTEEKKKLLIGTLSMRKEVKYENWKDKT